ncbi:IAA-alanine resistance protein 1 [Rhododendron vialii]|uniref:IAA-alanine resistance protein 1 n=1 Tax=Rhododendron vialii TaxID=182163 RepID=UPI00265E0187|nr:IAA-alanine resistance protein 1 [Rhododendron vialii]
MVTRSPQIRPFLLLVTVLVISFGSDPSFGHEGHHHHSGSCTSPVHEEVNEPHAHHNCDHGHDHHHHRDTRHDHVVGSKNMLPEELAEEEDLELYGFGSHHGHGHVHRHDHHGSSELSGVGLWIHAMGCSLLVSMASLICLIILPLIFIQGKPSKAVVDSLALFGAGAMLGDAFLHQLPHAFGGEHSHSHDIEDCGHSHVHVGVEPSHSHSLKDLSVGLSVLAGIVLFLVVEKIVRYVEENSRGASQWTHSHRHHHHHESSKKLKDDDDENMQKPHTEKNGSTSEMSSEEKLLDRGSDECVTGEKQSQSEFLRKRNTSTGAGEDKPIADAPNGSAERNNLVDREEPSHSSSNLVFGYLNLFSDGVHNFTDGMALGSAFLLYGSVGGWSRTLFLLAHELPQEIGDFGILVRSGFSVSRALFFNFLSALLALAGTAVALSMGQDPGQSSLIEGFTAGGFVYIAVAGVLAEMNNGSTTIKNTAIQVTSLLLGMSVALCISLVE